MREPSASSACRVNLPRAVVTVTRAGRSRFTRADAVYAAALREHFGRHLTAAQARALTAALAPVAEGRATRGAGSRTVRTG